MGNCRSRSKGCRTCVKRKVKCDETHPKCIRCKKGGFSCEGFKEATFIDARKQIMNRIKGESKASSSLSASATTNAKASSSKLSDVISTVTSATRDWQTSQPLQSSEHLPMSLGMSPFRDEVCISYTIKHLCKGPLAMMYCNVLPCNLIGLHPQQSTMNHCLLAMAKVFYAVKNHESRLLQDGIRLYGRGLNMLSDALGKANCSVTTEMIVSVFTLCVGESIMPTSKSSWMIHILGLERLFALRGPLMTEKSTILDRVLLESCRPLMILAAFFTQRPSLMGKPEWKLTTEPQDYDGSRNLFQTFLAQSDSSFLMGILAELPALYLQCNTCIELAKRNKSPDAHVSVIWSRMQQLQQELQGWKEKWNNYYSNKVRESKPTKVVDPIMAWTTVFHFSSVELANIFIMYHAVVILLTNIPMSLLKAGLGLNLSFSTTWDGHVMGLSQSLSDAETSARSICRSVEYYIQLLEPLQAPPDFYLFFPVHVARRTLFQLGHSSELTWLADAFEKMKLRFPMGLWANKDFDNRFSGFQEGLFG